MSSVLSPEVIAEARRRLREEWLREEDEEYTFQLATTWTAHTQQHFTFHMPLICGMQDPKDPNHIIPYMYGGRIDPSIYNKATVFYLTELADLTLGPLRGLMLLGGIWNAWVKAKGRTPHRPLDNFFAGPVRITKEIATTIPQILRTHKYVCFQARECLRNNFARNYAWSKDPRYFKLYPFCEALIVVLDEYTRIYTNPYPDGFRHLDDVAEIQTVILVRTGNSNGSRLSAPISFESLEVDALPFARVEEIGTIDAIRDPLQVGVTFIAQLMKQEEEAFLEFDLTGP
jgi:hypothetical protein